MASSSRYKILASVAVATGILALTLFTVETTISGTSLLFLRRRSHVQASRQLRAALALDPKTVKHKSSVLPVDVLNEPDNYGLLLEDPAD